MPEDKKTSKKKETPKKEAPKKEEAKKIAPKKEEPKKEEPKKAPAPKAEAKAKAPKLTTTKELFKAFATEAAGKDAATKAKLKAQFKRIWLPLKNKLTLLSSLKRNLVGKRGFFSYNQRVHYRRYLLIA